MAISTRLENFWNRAWFIREHSRKSSLYFSYILRKRDARNLERYGYIKRAFPRILGNDSAFLTVIMKFSLFLYKNSFHRLGMWQLHSSSLCRMLYIPPLPHANSDSSSYPRPYPRPAPAYLPQHLLLVAISFRQ